MQITNFKTKIESLNWETSTLREMKVNQEQLRNKETVDPLLPMNILEDIVKESKDIQEEISTASKDDMIEISKELLEEMIKKKINQSRKIEVDKLRQKLDENKQEFIKMQSIMEIKNEKILMKEEHIKKIEKELHLVLNDLKEK